MAYIFNQSIILQKKYTLNMYIGVRLQNCNYILQSSDEIIDHNKKLNWTD